MKFRKVMSALLAAMLVLSLAVPAFATPITSVDQLAEPVEIEVAGTTKTAEIKITVPTSASVILNPYELNVTVDGSQVQDQVISAVQAIKNESDLPVKVSTTVTGTIEGAEFATSSAVAETTKKVYLQFGVEAIADVADGGTPALTAGATKKTLSTTPVEFKDSDAVTMTKKGGATSSMAFGFTGDASKNPNSPWSSEDIVGATIAFTFALDNSGAGGGSTPTTPTPGVSVSLDRTTDQVLASGNATLNATFNAGSTGVTATSYTWSSSDESKYTVSGTSTAGTVSYVANGTATITVTVRGSDGADYTATVTYKNA